MQTEIETFPSSVTRDCISASACTGRANRKICFMFSRGGWRRSGFLLLPAVASFLFWLDFFFLLSFFFFFFLQEKGAGQGKGKLFLVKFLLQIFSFSQDENPFFPKNFLLLDNRGF